MAYMKKKTPIKAEEQMKMKKVATPMKMKKVATPIGLYKKESKPLGLFKKTATPIEENKAYMKKKTPIKK